MFCHCATQVFNKYVPFGLHHKDFGYDLSDQGLTESQRRRLAFPDRWLPGRKRQPSLVEISPHRLFTEDARSQFVVQ